jgi:hypothetical protein
MINEQVIKDFKQYLLDRPRRREEEKFVIEKYGQMFHPSNLESLTKENFKSFLLVKNNRHWEGIHRQSNMITSDMNKLREALGILLDESKPLKERLDILFPPKGNNYIKGLGRAIVTPVLLMVYPDKYGVFNKKSEAGLKKVNLLPDFKRKTFAEKYISINEILNNLAKEYNLTLWQVDEIFGWIMLGNSPIGSDEECEIGIKNVDESIEDYADFGLEAHLEDFLVENWEKLDLNKGYEIYTEDGDIVGQQYITPIGRIDLLCKSKDNKEWLILELKKGKSSDAVTGQILRYIGWIKENLAEPNQTVRGIIILGEIDEKLKYSVKTLDNVNVLTYSVSFQLKETEQ